MICSIDEYIKVAATNAPWKTAIVDKNLSLTYMQCEVLINSFALFLKDKIKPFDRVGVYCEKSLIQALVIFTVSRAKGVFVVINSKLKIDQVNHIVQDSQLACILTDKKCSSVLYGNSSIKKKSIIVSIRGNKSWLMTDLSGNKIKIKKTANKITSRNVRKNLAALIYTSGSTGLPKGVMLSQGNLIAGADSVTEYLQMSKNDKIISLLPFNFDYGLNQLLCSVKTHATLILCNYFFPHDIIKTLEQYKITVMAGIPNIWSQLLSFTPEINQRRQFNYMRCITNSGGKISRETISSLRKMFPQAMLYLMYGFTEAFRSTYLPPEELDQHPDSIGKAVPNAEIYLVNKNGEQVLAGEVGEIVHRGDTVAMGYWNNPKASKKVFKPLPGLSYNYDGKAAYSGDLAKQDAQGYLYYIGRKDQQIKVSGTRVSIDEIENNIMQVPEVLDASVLGIKTGKCDDLIIAYIIKKDKVDSKLIIKQCREQLPQFMVPKKIYFCSSFPQLASGKTNKAQLKKHYLSVNT